MEHPIINLKNEMNQYKKYFFLLMIILAACSKEKSPYANTPDCDFSRLYYVGDIKPIIDNNCAYSGCHSKNYGANNFDFTTYDGVKKGIGDIAIRIQKNVSSPLFMPQNKRVLDSCSYTKLRAWIDIGAPYN